jgi:mono/diheme cytochrome c family protein
VRSRPLLAVGLSGLLVVGVIAVIVLVIASGRNAGGSGLTAQERHGRELFTGTCQQCHTLRATNAVGMIGPDLDRWAPWGIPPGVVQSAVRDGRQSVYSGASMPKDLLFGNDVMDVAAFVHRATEDYQQRHGGPPALDWTPRITRTQPQTRPAPPQTPPRSPQERTTTNATPGRGG